MTTRVLLDATAVPVDRGGVGRYVDGLVGALVAHHRERVDLTVVAAPSDDAFAGLDIRTVVAPAAVTRTAARFAWEQTGLPVLARRLGADLVHSPHYTMPLAARCPVVVTLHDATFFSNPEWHSPVKGRFFRTWTRVAARRAASLVTPSVATRAALTRSVGVDAGRVTVAPLGVDTTRFAPPTAADEQRLRDHVGFTGDWVAFLGTVEPRKNVPALIAGWVDATRDRPAPPALVIAGGPGWDTGVEPALAAVPAALRPRVHRTGYLPLDLLPALLGGSRVAAYPSLGEGFGLPVLEAMACRAAVLTTRRLSLPEVGGDAVAYCEPDAGSIGAALTGLLDADTSSLRAAAYDRARAYTWQRCADAHVEAYERARERRR